MQIPCNTALLIRLTFSQSQRREAQIVTGLGQRKPAHAKNMLPLVLVRCQLCILEDEASLRC